MHNMEKICDQCGTEAPTLDDNGICHVCLETPMDRLDEENMLYVVRATDPYYTEQVYEAGGDLV